MFFVGVLTAFVACSIDITVEELCKLKFGLLRQLTDKGVAGNTRGLEVINVLQAVSVPGTPW